MARFPHKYPGAPGHNLEDPWVCFTSDCSYGCGCWAGPSRSGGPDGVDPFGECPNHPDKSIVGDGLTTEEQMVLIALSDPRVWPIIALVAKLSVRDTRLALEEIKKRATNAK